MFHKTLCSLLFVAFICGLAISKETQAQEKKAPAKKARWSYPPVMEGAKTEVYKTVGDVKLNMYIFNPKNHKPSDRRPVVVFFFGGGWRGGTPQQFENQCRYLASRGMVAMTADYRVSSRHKTNVLKCIADAKSAIRWVRKESKRLGIDPHRVVAGGGSAGGHIAACTGVIPGHEESGEDTSVSTVPDAMALFNPALVLSHVNGEQPFPADKMKKMGERIGADPKVASPYHHVKKGAPPTIIFHGIADDTVAYWTSEAFTGAMKKAGNRCELVGFKEMPHGFFNYGRNDNVPFRQTLYSMDKFLTSLGYLEGQPTIANE